MVAVKPPLRLKSFFCAQNGKWRLKMKYLRLKEVLEILPISKSTVWQWVKEGKFPVPIRLSLRCTVWEVSVIEQFVKNYEAAQNVKEASP
jgi:prophage regulatory protein